MTSFLFCFNSERAYSNNFLDWSSIYPGQEINIMGSDEKYHVVRNDTIKSFSKFKVEKDNIFTIENASEEMALNGDGIECSFESYSVFFVSGIIDGGTNFEIGQTLTLKEGSAYHSLVNQTDHASFLVKSVGPNGEIKRLEIINGGKFVKEYDSCKVSNNYGSSVQVNLIFKKNEKKIKEFFTVNDSELNNKKMTINIKEKLRNSFTNGEILINRHKITLNKPIKGVSLFAPFIAMVEKTPFLNLPLAKDNNVAQVFNQALLTIDSKIKELSL